MFSTYLSITKQPNSALLLPASPSVLQSGWKPNQAKPTGDRSMCLLGCVMAAACRILPKSRLHLFCDRDVKRTDTSVPSPCQQCKNTTVVVVLPKVPNIKFCLQRAVTSSYGTDGGSIWFPSVQVCAEEERLPASKQAHESWLTLLNVNGAPLWVIAGKRKNQKQTNKKSTQQESRMEVFSIRGGVARWKEKTLSTQRSTSKTEILSYTRVSEFQLTSHT